MGIDIGLKQLAVASVKYSKNKEINRQFHNGKQAAFIRKKYCSLRKNLGKAKKINVIKTIKDKEQRWMTDLNASRNIINKYLEQQSA